jgi:co-chaperonin GroES (HSP10)
MNKIPYTPIKSGIILEKPKVEKTDGGIILPDGVTSEQVSQISKSWEVLAVGPQVEQIKPGDHVMISGQSTMPSGFVVKDEDGELHQYIVYREHDVLLVVSPEQIALEKSKLPLSPHPVAP